MKRVLVCAILVALLASVPGAGSPLDGKRSLSKVKVAAMGDFPLEEKFKGGERACVIVKGDHDPVVDLGLFVYDEKGSLVAKDEGRGDIVAVIWYPPRDATYKIKIRNTGKVYNACYISLK